MGMEHECKREYTLCVCVCILLTLSFNDQLLKNEEKINIMDKKSEKNILYTEYTHTHAQRPKKKTPSNSGFVICITLFHNRLV